LETITPLKKTDLKPGERILRIEKTGYLPRTVRVALVPNQISRLPPITLFPSRVAVQFLSEPTGAEITLQYPDGRRQKVGKTTTRLDNLENSGRIVVIAELPGYQVLRRPLGQSAQTSATKFLELEKEEAAAPPRPAARRWERRRRAPRPRRDEDAPPPASGKPEHGPAKVIEVERQPQAPAKPGLLRVQSKPKCMVSVNGKPIGWTPILGYELPPGTYTVVFSREIPPKFRAEKTAVIQPGESKFVRYDYPP